MLAASGLPVCAQQPMAQDSIQSTSGRHKKEDHSARKATIYSAALPGLGQIYNRKYWKLPLVYGGFFMLGYYINFNHDNFELFSQAYLDITDDDPNTTSYLRLRLNPNTDLNNPAHRTRLTQNLRAGRDYWRRNRDLLIISTAAFYALNIIDASVDAHFFNFDVSDDLTVRWMPGPVYCMDQQLPGIYCRITF